MYMGLSLGQRQTLKTELSQSQVLGQFLSQQLDLRIQLLDQVRGEKFEPKAACPECFHQLTAGEIVSGFTRDPQDQTTVCPECGHRFSANLVAKSVASSVEVIFYCPVQVLENLRNTESLSPDDLRRKNASVYYSAIFHFGTLKAAFGRLNVTYGFAEEIDWQDKVRSFLGLVPDRLIADVCGVSPHTVGRFRQSLDILPFSKHRILEEIQEEAD